MRGLNRWLRRREAKDAGVCWRAGLFVTVIGLQFGVLLSGAVITETVFAVPGTGRLILRAIGQLDFPVVQAGVMTLSLLIVVVNFVVDLLYLYLKPQVRIS